MVVSPFKTLLVGKKELLTTTGMPVWRYRKLVESGELKRAKCSTANRPLYPAACLERLLR